MDSAQLEQEVDANYDAFVRCLPDLMRDHARETALMRQGNVVAFYKDSSEALAEGRVRFSDGLFSIQQVTDQPIDLGLLSHAIDPRIA